MIVAAGGDGTINEVAEGMLNSDVPLAILPGGTANVLAMEMKLGNRLERVAARLDEFRPRRVPVFRTRTQAATPEAPGGACSSVTDS